MVTDQQVKLLFKLVHAEPNNEIAEYPKYYSTGNLSLKS